MTEKSAFIRRLALMLKAAQFPSGKPRLALDAVDLHDALTSDVDAIVEAIVHAHPWDFAVDSATRACVADQGEYTLKGNSQDCWQIFELKYGTGTDISTYATLTKKSPEKMSDYEQSGAAGAVEFWVPIKREGRFPVIEVKKAPPSASYTLFYRYWMNTVAYEALPGDLFLVPIIVGVRFLWGLATETEFQAAITRVIVEYDRPSSPEDTTITMDPAVRNLNRLRNARFGYNSGQNQTVVIEEV